MDTNKYTHFINESDVKSKVEGRFNAFLSCFRIGLAQWNLENSQNRKAEEIKDIIVQELGDKGYQLVLFTQNSYARALRLAGYENLPEKDALACMVEIPQTLFCLAQQIEKTRELENEIKKLENTINMLAAQADMEKP
jgi:hypothetical protein